MLSSILSGETCANCRNCCVFEVQSTWELPTFPAKAAARLAENPAYTVKQEGTRFRITLPDTGTAQPCPFLDPHSGCTLPADEKPFACKLWPVRVMRRADGSPALALYRGCPGIPDADALRPLLENGLRARIFAEAERDPSLILPYHPNYDWI